MAVMKSKDGKNLLVDCSCGCNEGFYIRVKGEDDSYVMLTYTNGNFYRDQTTSWQLFCRKWRKVWRILRNKDYCYSEVYMTKEDFLEFQSYIASIGK